MSGNRRLVLLQDKGDWLFGGENVGGDSIEVQCVLRVRSPRELFDMGFFDYLAG
jgi:hypothetical protein